MCQRSFLRWFRVYCVVLDSAPTAGGVVITSRTESFCVTDVRHP